MKNLKQSNFTSTLKKKKRTNYVYSQEKKGSRIKADRNERETRKIIIKKNYGFFFNMNSIDKYLARIFKKREDSNKT